jgi:hypothetical protein
MDMKKIIKESDSNSLVNMLVSFLTSGLKLDNLELDSEKEDTQISKPSLSDDGVYEAILTGIGAPITKENMKFMYGWRQAEAAKAAFNPFNTTKKKEKSTFYNCLSRKDGKCVGGVRNYSSQQEGIDATIETLKLSYYTCITNGLKNDIGAKKIARQCKDALKTWGTGELLAKVLDGSKLSPSPIPTTTTKTVT